MRENNENHGLCYAPLGWFCGNRGGPKMKLVKLQGYSRATADQIQTRAVRVMGKTSKGGADKGDCEAYVGRVILMMELYAPQSRLTLRNSGPLTRPSNYRTIVREKVLHKASLAPYIYGARDAVRSTILALWCDNWKTPLSSFLGTSAWRCRRVVTTKCWSSI